MTMIQHPYNSEKQIELESMLLLVDKVFDRLRDLDRATENGIDFINASNRVLNDINGRLQSDEDKAAFNAAAIPRYIGEV
jgi:hypothetical protein